MGKSVVHKTLGMTRANFVIMHYTIGSVHEILVPIALINATLSTGMHNYLLGLEVKSLA